VIHTVGILTINNEEYIEEYTNYSYHPVKTTLYIINIYLDLYRATGRNFISPKKNFS
jgi:hypothetical protein